jgi:hypothetical protein
VTNPGIWVLLAVIILLLTGVFVWSAMGKLETKAEAKVIVQNHTATIITTGNEEMASGMVFRVAEDEYKIASTDTDEYGRFVGTADVSLPDGSYDAYVVTESVHPIDFLLNSR